MADPPWNRKIFQMVEKMSLEEGRQLIDACDRATSKQQAGRHEQVRAWFEKNYLLMEAIQTQFQQGNTLGLSERDMADFTEDGGIFKSISGGYKYAVLDWQNQDPQGALAAQYYADIRNNSAYPLFSALSKSLHDQVAVIEPDLARRQQKENERQARAQQRENEAQEKEKAEKRAKRLAEKAEKTQEGFLGRMAARDDAEEKQVVCLLILPNGNYYEGIHTDVISDGDLHPIARKIAQGDRVAGQSIKSCAEFKALNKYLKAVLPNATEQSDVPSGGHTMAYVYLKRSGNFVLKPKAACENCGNWLAALGWTAAPGEY